MLHKLQSKTESHTTIAITAVGVVPFGGHKKFPYIKTTIVQIIFSFWSFEISMDILRYQKKISVRGGSIVYSQSMF